MLEPEGSPVFVSSAMFSSSSKRSRKTLDFGEKSFGEHCMIQKSDENYSQQIESIPSTQKSSKDVILSRHDSNHISSASSFQSNRLEDVDTTFREKLVQEDVVKKRKPKKNGLLEQLNNALKQQNSDRILNKHLPSKILSTKQSIMKAKITEVNISFSILLISCQNVKMDSHVKEFDLILEKSSPICEKIKKGSDVILQGPWNAFDDSDGKKSICNVAHIEVIPSSLESRNETTDKTTIAIFKPQNCKLLSSEL